MPQGEVNRAYLIELMRKIADLPPEKHKPKENDGPREVMSETMQDVLLTVYDNGPITTKGVVEYTGKGYDMTVTYLSRLKSRGMVGGDKLELKGSPMEWYCTPYGCEVVEAIVKRLRGKAS